MQVRRVFQQYAFVGAISLGIHLLIFYTFTLKFSNPIMPIKPSFVFLGSFLSDQDFSLLTFDESSYREQSSAQTVNLDIRPSISRQVEKPTWLKGTIIDAKSKSQFKPIMKNEALIRKVTPGTNDSEMNFEPFKPIRMRINSDD